ncbi:MAG: BrnT family toxin [Betaproteobacteria bacterium]|nr:MAG: BrnT family toxin [Betaproteobacteria bacterium]
MHFESDPAKAAFNLRKHGVSFADAEGALQDPRAVTVEDADAKDEQRFITIGMGNAGELLVVVWTERGDARRVISARHPTPKERNDYES